MDDRLVLGLDVGGTSTRAVVVSAGGERIASGRAGGGNPVSNGMETAGANIAAAIASALHGLDPARVAGAVAGQAGVLGAQQGFREVYRKIWGDAGLTCPYRLVWDGTVGFASGTAARSGTMLIGGTGGIAGRITDHELVRHSDGYGWLLGDLGAGVWIGREAVRRALLDLEAGAPGRDLTRAVLDHYGLTVSDPEDAWIDVVRSVYADAPVRLARLTPIVFEAWAAGDPGAAEIVAQAAAHLVETTAAVHEDGPIVLGGGILTSATPVADAVRRGIGARWPDAEVCIAGDAVAGAAWLAACDLPGVDAEALHARLL